MSVSQEAYCWWWARCCIYLQWSSSIIVLKKRRIEHIVRYAFSGPSCRIMVAMRTKDGWWANKNAGDDCCQRRRDFGSQCFYFIAPSVTVERLPCIVLRDPRVGARTRWKLPQATSCPPRKATGGLTTFRRKVGSSGWARTAIQYMNPLETARTGYENPIMGSEQPSVVALMFDRRSWLTRVDRHSWWPSHVRL
jgi:hypothetical protein